MDNATKWLLKGQIGLSSKSMLAAHLGDTTVEINHPYDPSDFNRCLLMLEMVPEARGSFDEIAKLSPVWARLIERWGEVEKSFIDEVGLGWSKANRAPKTYKLMKEIIDAA